MQLTAAHYLWEAFKGLGPRDKNGGPVSYTEIYSFSQIWETDLDRRDLSILRLMSESYSTEYERGKNAFAEPPGV